MASVSAEDAPILRPYMGLGVLCGRHGLNIATFHLGRRNVGGEAVALVEVDGALPAGVLDEIKLLPQVVRADSLQFSAQD